MVKAIDKDKLMEAIAWNGQAGMIMSIGDVLDIIEEFPTLTPPNEPLALEELRDMDGEPVYVVISGVDTLKMWALVEVVKDEKCVILTNNLGGRSEYYDDDELKYDGIKVYRHPPEESR